MGLLLAVARPWRSGPAPGVPQAGPAPPPSPHLVVAGQMGPRDTLAGALRRLGASAEATHAIAKALGEILDVRRIPPGGRLVLFLGPDRQPARFVYTESPLDIYEVVLEGGGWQATRQAVSAERRTVRVAGDIRSSLFESLEALGEGPQLAADFVEIFVWTFDFNRRAQPGDRFRLLSEKLYADGTFARYGRILAAEYEARGGARRAGPEVHTAIFFAHEGKGGYYTFQGESLRRAFLKSPLPFTRITSGYSRHRRHPILGGVRPHLAIDYAAPAGTPVWAVADGIVEYAGWRGGNGISVTIRHRANFKTMYNHLSRVAKGIRPGRPVRQRQVIGFVGSTGLSTGPHLDYRVIKDGRFIDPMRQAFLPGTPVPPQGRAAFEATRDRLLRELRAPSKSGASLAGR